MNSEIAIQASVNFTANQIVDKAYATIGDTITYTLNITNNGDADALNLIVTDLVPQGANFINDTVKIDTVSQSGVNPALGINVGTVPIGASKSIELKATVVTVPWSNNLSNYSQLDYQYIDPTTTPNTVTTSINSNTVVTTINAVILGIQKTAAETVVSGNGQTINYTLRVANSGSVTATNLLILDTVPVGTSFVPGSVSVLGTPQPTETIEPPTGYSFGNLPANSYTTISFKVTVNSIPASGSITNTANGIYSYNIDPITPINSRGSNISNSLVISAVRADLSGIRKAVDKVYATTGSILTYTITLPNSGNTTAFNVILQDTIPNGTSFITNSVIVNGVTTTFNPTSIAVGTINVGATATVQFKVVVN